MATSVVALCKSHNIPNGDFIGRHARDELAFFRILRKHGIRFPTFYDYQEQIETVLKISEYPSSLLLSPRGRILARVVGPREWDSDVQKQWLRERMAHNEQG